MRDRRCSRAPGEPRLSDRCLGLDPRPVLKLVDHVAVSGQRQSRVVTELARHVYDARPSCRRSEAKLCRRSYGRACARLAACVARLNARRRHDW
jgi:hypothetical protein